MRSTRRATSRSESTSRPESISSRIANCGCSTASCTVSARFCSPPENSSLTPRAQQLGAHAERGRLGQHRVVQTVGVDVAGAHRRGDERLERHAGHFHRVLHREEQPALRALPRGQADELFAVDRDRAAGHLVVGRGPSARATASTCPSRSGPSARALRPSATSRSTPCRISLPATLHAQTRRSSRMLTGPPPSRRRLRRRRRRPGPAGSPAASAARRSAARTSSRASGTRSRSSSAHTSPSDKREVGVRAGVADRVEVVADAHDRDAVAVDVEATRANRARGRHGRTRAARHPSVLARRCSSLSTTERRSPLDSALTGRRSSTSSKNPSTIRRSASSGGMPRLSR